VPGDLGSADFNLQVLEIRRRFGAIDAIAFDRHGAAFC
jgi:hypothetical protein